MGEGFGDDSARRCCRCYAGIVIPRGIRQAVPARSVRDEAGRTYWRNTPQRAMVVRSETARACDGHARARRRRPKATGKAARVPGVRVAGKTGTSALQEPEAPPVYASFIGIVPADAPKLVILVGVYPIPAREVGRDRRRARLCAHRGARIVVC